MRKIQLVDGSAWWVASRRRRIGELRVGVWDGDHDAKIFAKIGDALDLIKAHDPRRHERLSRDLRRI